MEKTPLDYIDLGRHFRRHDEQEAADEAAAASYLSSWERQHLEKWPTLLAKPGVHIVLGEAGSGRTYEFKARANVLRAEGREAFFLSLHKLATLGLSQAIEVEDHQRLIKCIRDHQDICFFLDAVDESKLQRVAQFREALDKFASLIQGGTGKATIFISSRVKDWLPATDRRHVQEAFGLVKEDSAANSELNNNEGKSPKARTGVHVWTIAPLDKQQVELYVEGHGVSDAAGFIAALDEAYAWELASRPIDVNLLVSYWKSNRTIGRPAEMFEHLICEQLKERPEKAEYERLFSIDPGKALQGAETLAAATILCRQLDFRVEDEQHFDAKGLDARACLPDDWQPATVHALLSRPLFDTAIYGCTRFHHRGFAEYLAARWFIRLLDSECSIEEVADLLFSSSRGHLHARDSRLPVAVWLACIGSGEWVNQIRQNLLECAPEAFFRHGDPSLLPAAFKQRILDAVVERYGQRDTLRFHASEVALSRMADPALATSLIHHLSSPEVSSALKAEFIKLATVGRLYSAVPVILDLMRGGSEDSCFISRAFSFIKELADPDQLQSAAVWIQSLPDINCDLCGLAIETLFPKFLKPAELALMLTRLSDLSNASLWLKYRICQNFEGVHEPTLAVSTLNVLLPLLESPPYYERAIISQKYLWLGPAIRVLLRNVLTVSSLNEIAEKTIIQALWLCTQQDVGHLGEFEYDPSNNKEPTLGFLTRNYPSVRRAVFWLHYDKERQRRERYGSWITKWVWSSFLKFGQATDLDFEWFCHDMQQSSCGDRNRAALDLAIIYWKKQGSRRAVKSCIKSAVQNTPELRIAFVEFTRIQWCGNLMFWWREQECNGFRNRYWWLERRDKMSRFYWNIYNVIWLRLNRKSIRLGSNPEVLENLLSENRSSYDFQWAPKNWRKLTQIHGEYITLAIQQGCVAVWKHYDPIDSVAVRAELIAGLAGLQYLWQKGELQIDDWTSDDIERATRYAIRELNGVSNWLPCLARKHPDAVIRVIESRIDEEWANNDDNTAIQILEKMYWPESCLVALLAPILLGRLQAGDPPSVARLRSTLNILVASGKVNNSVYANIAAERVPQYIWGTAQHQEWLSLWMQADTNAVLNYLDKNIISGIINESQLNSMAISICASFEDHHYQSRILPYPDYSLPAVAPRFIRWVYQCVRPESDINRGRGSYSPTIRDHAQNFRRRLLDYLAGVDTVEAGTALLSLLDKPEMRSRRDYLLHLAENQARRIADGNPWTANAIRIFETAHRVEPMNTADLFAIGCRRLRLIKKMVEQPFDIIVGGYVREKDDETRLRQFLAMKLSDLSKGLYKASQEPVIRGELRPDLRLENNSIVGSIPIEVKLADERTLNSLLDDLERQLVDDYLSNYVSRHGIFIVGLAGRRVSGWQDPDTRVMLNFDEVINRLRQRAIELLSQGGRALGLEVIGIDFRLPQSARN
ncbi:MAG: hypothetical protein V4672_14435 [Verrucomicrobiota bacterium]